jgi:hypothetical protein
MTWAKCVLMSLASLWLFLVPLSTASGAGPGEKVEVTIFYSADICGYLEPCG